MFEYTNAMVIDIESAENPEKCIYCDIDNRIDHQKERYHDYTPIGWDKRKEYGLSIGCYWDYWNNSWGIFDTYTLPLFVKNLVHRKPMLISFNGIGFDFPTMNEVMLGMVPEDHRLYEQIKYNSNRFCDIYKDSYDIFYQIRTKNNRSQRGLNTLDSLCRYNGINNKSGSGKEAPSLWKRRRIAQLVEYCRNDVMITKQLAEKVCSREGRIHREDDHVDINYLKQDDRNLIMVKPSYHKQYNMF